MTTFGKLCSKQSKKFWAVVLVKIFHAASLFHSKVFFGNFRVCWRQKFAGKCQKSQILGGDGFRQGQLELVA